MGIMKNQAGFEGLHVILRDMITSILQENSLDTPALLFSGELLRNNIDFFRNTIVVDKIYFPVKTNNQVDVLDILKSAGIFFEAASLGELQLLSSIDVRSEDIIFGNPVKLDKHIGFAARMGIDTYSVDTESELIKINKHMKNANVYLRLDVSNKGSAWDLSDKFGCDAQDAIDLFRKATDLKMNAVGVSFHVGWNNSDTATWEQAVIKAYQVIRQCRDVNINLRFINIGGGFPAHLNNQYDMLRRIAGVINPHLTRIKNEFNMEVYAEPGSFLAANAGVTVSRVMNVIKRKNRLWVYLDTGINQGFSWIMSGLKYAVFSPEKIEPPLTEYIVCGPTCDSHDLFDRHSLLSSKLQEDDLLLIYPAGAYISSSKTYNGFDFPVTRVIS